MSSRQLRKADSTTTPRDDLSYVVACRILSRLFELLPISSLSSDIIEPSTEPDTDQIRFDTYRYYLESIGVHMTSAHRSLAEFASTAADTTEKLQPLQCDRNWIERYLKLAWNTEYLLAAGPDDPELLQLQTAWTPVQAYYAVYCACEAAGYVIDGDKPGSHGKALRKVTEYFCSRGLSPWDKAYEGPLEKNYNDPDAVNFPEGLTPCHNLKRSSVRPLEMIARCLKAEHKNRVEERWARGSFNCFKYELEVGRTGVLHFLYRLRLKANYSDVDLFLVELPARYVTGFNERLRELVSWTLLYLEMIVLRRVLKGELLPMIDAYLSTNPNASQLRERRSILDGTI